MSTLSKLRTVTALAGLGTLGWIGVHDMKSANIREAAETRELTQEELDHNKSQPLPFYASIGVFPAYILVRALDEREKKKKQTEAIENASNWQI